MVTRFKEKININGMIKLTVTIEKLIYLAFRTFFRKRLAIFLKM